MTTPPAAHRRGARLHRARWRRLVRAVGFGIGAGLPVAVLALMVRSTASPVVVLDGYTITAATALTRDHPALHTALVVWQALFQAKWVNLAVTGLCVWVWRRRGLASRALWAFVTLMVSWNLGLLVKLLVQRTRPIVADAVAYAPGYSFPSGHAANTAAAGLTVTLLVWPLLRRRARVVVPVVVGVVVLLTAADRVLLGVHYPSDVVAGIAFGGALVGGSYLGYLGWNPAVSHPHHETETPGAVAAALRERHVPTDGRPGGE